MEQQTSAERRRRAMILEAQGERRSAVETAEGDKQSNIIYAQGEKQSQILEAQGDAVSTVLRVKSAESMGERAIIEKGILAKPLIQFTRRQRISCGSLLLTIPTSMGTSELHFQQQPISITLMDTISLQTTKFELIYEPSRWMQQP